MTKRKNHAPEFKAKVALEVIRGEMTLAELSKKYGVLAAQISTWTQVVVQNMASAFARRGHDPDTPGIADIEKLHSKIGQVLVEWDFLADAPMQLLGGRGKNSEQGL